MSWICFKIFWKKKKRLKERKKDRKIVGQNLGKISVEYASGSWGIPYTCLLGNILENFTLERSNYNVKGYNVGCF